jgi:hypothetical protein
MWNAFVKIACLLHWNVKWILTCHPKKKKKKHPSKYTTNCAFSPLVVK